VCPATIFARDLLELDFEDGCDGIEVTGFRRGDLQYAIFDAPLTGLDVAQNSDAIDVWNVAVFSEVFDVERGSGFRLAEQDHVDGSAVF